MTTLYSQPETSYILDGLLSDPIERVDGRKFDDFRSLAFEVGNSGLATGSSYVAGAGCEWQIGIKLDVENGSGGLECFVDYSSNALSSQNIPSNLSTSLLSNLLNVTISPCLPKSQFIIIESQNSIKAFRLQLNAMLMSATDCSVSSLMDTLFLGVRMALLNARIPRTRPLAFEAHGDADVAKDAGDIEKFGLNTSGAANRFSNKKAIDFELEDVWNEGDPIQGTESLPVSVTLNVIQNNYFLDATPIESSIPGLMSFTILVNPDGNIRGTQMFGSGEVEYRQLPQLIKDGQNIAKDLLKLFNNYEMHEPSSMI